MTEEEVERIAREWCSARFLDPDRRVTLMVLEKVATPFGVVTLDGENWQPAWTVYAHDIRLLSKMGVLKE